MDEVKSSISLLLKSKGWEILCQHLEENLGWRKTKVLFSPLGGDWNVHAQEFMKGEIAGLELAKILPHTILEGIEVSQAMKEQKDESE